MDPLARETHSQTLRETHDARPVDMPERERAARDLDTSYVVEAGAGTGKTSLLIERVMNIIRSGRADLDQVVAITFTEKAAGELKLRLRDQVDTELGAAADPHPRRLLERARERLDRASITTIHSFAAGLIKERPVEAGVDPGFAVLDEIGSGLLLDEAWEEWIASELGARDLRTGNRAAVSLALQCGIRLEALRDLALRLYAERDVAAESRSPWAPVDPDALAAPWAEVRDALGDLRSLVESGGCEESDGAFSAVASTWQRFRALEQVSAADALDRAAVLASGALQLPSGRGKSPAPGRSSSWADQAALARFRDAYADLQALLSGHAAAARAAVAEGLGAWICGPGGFLEFVERAKQQRGVLDFQDLLIKARNMLRDSAEARRHFQGKFSYILVDEFQDTDPLQVELVFFLSEDPCGVAGASEDASERGDGRAAATAGTAAGTAAWRGVRPAPGKLFIVGDPKQSIYRFRRADIEVYEQAKAQLVNECPRGEELTIRVNFRSLPQILNWVNVAFSAAMAPAGAGDAGAGAPSFQARFVPLVGFRREPGPAPGDGAAPGAAVPGGGAPAGPAARVLALSVAPAESGTSAEARQAEAEAIASWIAGARGLSLCTDAEGRPRAMGCSDVAILFPGMTGIDAYERSLSERGIPYRLEGGKLFYARREVRVLVDALRAVADPSDGVALVGLLRSPAFGVTDEELARHVLSGGALNYLEPVAADVATDGGSRAGGALPGLAEALAVLREIHGLRNSQPLARTVETVLERTGLVRLLLLQPRGRQAIANLYKVVDMARAMDHSGMVVSFSGFVRYLRGLAAQRIAEAESPMAEPGEEAVTLLTVHKAKGLEFPVVVLANLVSGDRAGDSLVVDRRNREVSFRLGPANQGYATKGFKDASACEAVRGRAEDVRLLYVAATRARDLLVIPKTGADSEKLRGGSRYLPYLAEQILALPAEPEPAGRAPAPLPPAARSEVAPSRADLVATREGLRAGMSPPAAAGGVAIAVAAAVAAGVAAGVAAAGEDTWEDAGERVPDVSDAQPPDEAASKAAAMGTALHAVMERVNLRVAGWDATLLRRASEAAAAESGVAGAAGEVATLAARCLEAPVMARAMAAVAAGGRAYREVPYAVAPPEGGPAAATRGRMDLVFEEPDGLVIVDFKTDRCTPGEFEARVHGAFRAQGEAYSAAARMLTGRPVKEIVFVQANSAMEVSVRPGGK